MASPKPRTSSSECDSALKSPDRIEHERSPMLADEAVRNCLDITLPNIRSFWVGFRSSVPHGTDLCGD